MTDHQETSFADLPPEIQLLIFSRLDFASRIGCTLVCKDWNQLVMSGAFLNHHVVMKASVDCRCPWLKKHTPVKTARYIGSVLLQSSRNYRALAFHYHHGTQPRITSMLAVFEKFSDLTYLHFEQRHQPTHIHFIEQIVQLCPGLKTLVISIIVATGKAKGIPLLENKLAELTLINVNVQDFEMLVRMFANVPSFTLRSARFRADNVQFLVEWMPLLEALHLRRVHIMGPHPLRLIKRLHRLREFSIVDSAFSGDFQKWPKLPRSTRVVTLDRCINVVMVDQMFNRWKFVEKLQITDLNYFRYFYNEL